MEVTRREIIVGKYSVEVYIVEDVVLASHWNQEALLRAVAVLREEGFELEGSVAAWVSHGTHFMATLVKKNEKK